MTCARGTRKRPYPAHLRIFGACYWCLLLTSPAVLSLRYAACVSQSVAVSWSAAVGWEVSQSAVVSNVTCEWSVGELGGLSVSQNRGG